MRNCSSLLLRCGGAWLSSMRAQIGHHCAVHGSARAAAAAASDTASPTPSAGSASPDPAAPTSSSPEGLADSAFATEPASAGAVSAPSTSGDGGAQEAAAPMSPFAPRLVQPLRRGPAPVAKREGIVHIHNTSNNCMLVLTDLAGQVKTWTSGGSVGFKNSGKATPLAAEAAAAELARRALAKGFYSVVVKLKGAGRSKQYAVASLAAAGVTITQLQEVTPIPYNGCRLPRKRRT